jgi:hypothetical protein
MPVIMTTVLMIARGAATGKTNSTLREHDD